MKTKYDAATIASGVTTNWSEYRIGTNVMWSPVKGFGIGAELMYAKLKQSSPVYFFPGSALNGFRNESLLEPRIRVQRAF